MRIAPAIRPVAPQNVERGDRLKAATVNALIDNMGVREIRTNKIPYAAGLNDDAEWAFGWRLNGADVIVNGGVIRIHGDNNYAGFTGDTVTLTGTPEWVFIRMVWASKVITLEHSSTNPLSDATNLDWPLVKFTASSGNYALDQRLWRGDIQLGTAQRAS